MKLWSGCWIAPAAFALDRVTKHFAQAALRGNAPVTVIPFALRLIYVENTGAAFGALSGQRVLLLVLTGVALLALLFFQIFRGARLPRLVRVSLWLVIGGAAGNFFDRLFLGYVIDFIEVTLFRFPVFNIADMCVVAAFALLVCLILFSKEEKADA